jgi:TRAP-type C4-dicarboxylate transport system substrate-binding protein
MERKLVLLSISLFLVTLFFVTQNAFSEVGKPIELKFASFLSPMHHEHIEAFVPFAKAVEERTNGRVKITIYPSEALCKARDLYDCALQGVSETAYFIPSYTAGRFPLTTVMELPISVPSAKVGTQVIWELYKKYLKSEYSGVKLLSLWTIQPAHIFTTKKSIKTLADLKGLRIRSPGPLQTIMLRELGASPISMPASDLYDALQRGMVDGMLTDFAALKGFRFHEVVKYCTILNSYVLPMGYAINLKTWNSLPPDIQKIMEELGGFRFAESNAKSFDKNDIVGRELAKGKIEIYELTAEEKKIWAQKFKNINEKWVADIEAKGLPGKEVYEETLSLLKKYSK